MSWETVLETGEVVHLWKDFDGIEWMRCWKELRLGFIGEVVWGLGYSMFCIMLKY